MKVCIFYCCDGVRLPNFFFRQHTPAPDRHFAPVSDPTPDPIRLEYTSSRPITEVKQGWDC